MSADGLSRRRPAWAMIVLLLAALAVAAVAALGVGRYDIAFHRVIAILLSPIHPPDIAVTPTEATCGWA